MSGFIVTLLTIFGTGLLRRGRGKSGARVALDTVGEVNKG